MYKWKLGLYQSTKLNPYNNLHWKSYDPNLRGLYLWITDLIPIRSRRSTLSMTLVHLKMVRFLVLQITVRIRFRFHSGFRCGHYPLNQRSKIDCIVFLSAPIGIDHSCIYIWLFLLDSLLDIVGCKWNDLLNQMSNSNQLEYFHNF